MISFTGQTVVITGAAGGIASETARLMHGAGAHLVLADISEAALQALVNRLGLDAERCLCVPVNVELLTLQQGVSENQFAQMQEAGVKLVVPKGLHSSYPKKVRPNLESVEGFITSIRSIKY